MNPISERIEELEAEIRKTPHHKGTEHHIGTLRARIAQLKEKLANQGVGTSNRVVYAIKKEGDATIMLIGFPSVGKSSLLNVLTNASSETASYEFTTLKPVPGMLEHKKAKIQIIDLPGIIEHASRGAGRGREILSALRSSDLLLIMLNPQKPRKELEVIKRELEKSGIRINKKPKKVIIKKTVRGGLKINSVKQTMGVELIKKTFQSFGINNAEVAINQKLTQDDLIDSITGNRHYVNAMFIVTKGDIRSVRSFFQVSSKTGDNILKLKELLYDCLKLARVYTRKPSGETDYEKPLIVRKPITVREVMNKLRIKKNMCKITGSSAKFANQIVSLNHVITDEDVLTFY